MRHLRRFIESLEFATEDGFKYKKDDSLGFKKGDYVAREHYIDNQFEGYEVKQIAHVRSNDPFADKRFAEVFFDREIGTVRVVGLGTGWFKVKRIG